MNDRHYEKMSEAELSKKLGQYQKQARIWTIIGLVGVLGGVISFFAVDDMALKSILTAVLFFGGVCLTVSRRRCSEKAESSYAGANGRFLPRGA